MQQQTIETLRQALQESALPFAQQEPLASHTTFQIGGPAVFWCTPKTVDQLRRTLALCRENGVRTYLLGNGSNTLFADEGYDGAVIDLRGLNFGPTAEPRPDGSTRLTAGAGLTLGRLCAVAQQQSLAGIAFACGIPGTIGGALRSRDTDLMIGALRTLGLGVCGDRDALTVDGRIAPACLLAWLEPVA